MKTEIHQHGFSLWLSARDTYAWATKPGATWPCSQLRDNRLFVAYDSNGLCDFTLNGKDADVDGTELSAIVADTMRHRLPKEHCSYFVAVAQFPAHFD